MEHILAKMMEDGDHCKDLWKIFVEIRKFKMCLNPKKCAFAVCGGKFLGTHQSRNWGKFREVPSNIGDEESEQPRRDATISKAHNRPIQVLGKVGRTSTPVFPSFEEASKLQMDRKYERAFQDLEKFLIEPPVLSKPMDGEPFYIYLLVTEKAISLVLVREEEKQQKSVYYISKAL